MESQDSPEDENPVMNFFKTLVTPTKTSKKEAPAADALKDQVAQVCDPPAVPKGMPAPPPPPPEPPRAEPAAKAKEEPKAAKDSPKGKSAKDTLTRLFRSKKPDASKASTLEAAAKPAPAPAAAQQEKQPQAKKTFLSFLKPKALLDSVSSTVQAASTSGVQLLRKATAAAAAEPKAAPAPAAAAGGEPGPSKEEPPKAAKSTEATAEAKPATAAPSGGEEAASAPKKLEKRNSITLFFKNLSGKRPSTDAGAQSEAAPAPSAEKTK